MRSGGRFLILQARFAVFVSRHLRPFVVLKSIEWLTILCGGRNAAATHCYNATLLAGCWGLPANVMDCNCVLISLAMFHSCHDCDQRYMGKAHLIDVLYCFRGRGELLKLFFMHWWTFTKHCSEGLGTGLHFLFKFSTYWSISVCFFSY